MCLTLAFTPASARWPSIMPGWMLVPPLPCKVAIWALIVPLESARVIGTITRAAESNATTQI